MSANTPGFTNQLASTHQKIVAPGENLPAVQLNDRTTVQTGTVAAMLHDVSLHNEGTRGDVEGELALPTGRSPSRGLPARRSSPGP